MSAKYGIHIQNIQAGSIFECNCGVREYLDTTPAMLVNSLFKDFLLENGLKLYGKEQDKTRDIICIEFEYGSRSAKEERKHLEKLLDATVPEAFSSKEKYEKKKEFLENQISFLNENEELFIRKSKQRLRKDFYENGVDVTYHRRKKNEPSTILSSQTIHYKMLYRTPGKAKKGTCMFICEELYERAKDFLYMGLTLPEKNAPIVEIGAYASLITSGIEGRIEIDPKKILVIPDVDSEYYADVIGINVDDGKHCFAEVMKNYKLKNTMFDGQALIDTSIFPEWGDGYVLLRHHMCKMAAFHSNIQLFIKDWCKNNNKDYDTLVLKDYWGNDILAKDIQLVTTENAMKWIKFDIDYNYWSSWVNKNGNLFGVVKTAHKSKLGNVQQMSYQMVNALDINTMDNIYSTTKEYIESLKNNDEEFLKYLVRNSNFVNDYEVLVALANHNKDFVNSKYFKTRRSDIIHQYTYNLGFGKLLQEGDNLVIVGSPYAMLLHMVGEDVSKDDTFTTEDGAIQCYTGRFKDGEYLAEFRSPFNSRNNLGYLHNVYSKNMLKYFNFGKQIIAVNMQHTDFQDRNNGSDQDSDGLYVTNQKDIVKHASYCYTNYLTIKNNIPQDKKHYDLSMKNYAKIDNELAAAQMAIGESSNIAQQCLTYTYNDEDPIYQDYVCILSVLAQVAIDNAKRKYDIDLTQEIGRIKRDLADRGCKFPTFWIQVKKRNDKRHNKNKKKTKDQWKNFYAKFSSKLICPMNYICNLEIENKKNTKTIPDEDFFEKIEFNPERYKKNKRKNKQIEQLIQDYSLELYNYNSKEDTENEQWLLLHSDFDNLINDIKRLSTKLDLKELMLWLIKRGFKSSTSARYAHFKSKLHKNRSILLKTLYTVNPEIFLECFKNNL